VLERSSMVNGVRLPRWTTNHIVDQPAEWAYLLLPIQPSLPCSPLSLDDSQPTLSPLQLDQRACWRPASEVLPKAQMVSRSLKGRDIVQDNVSDCSLVSALIIGAEHHSKFGSRVSPRRVRSPFDDADVSYSSAFPVCTLKETTAYLASARPAAILLVSRSTGLGGWLVGEAPSLRLSC